MRSTQKLIELIKKRDVLAILAEDSLVEDFNELLKYELIDIVDDKVMLTPKGEKDRNIGLDEILTKFRIQEQNIFSAKRNH
ncbi:MAG: hypothetical protein RI572_09560 [Salegentibacter sp.]|uniref:Uncharacterized protein n=1 Tax=Salegentibacter flavus TaxID=287099 RepID=A0A1I5BY35_9FLAO|nr:MULTISPECIES: hypothetical protein [Salegentibacter]MDR9457645.1 hypothetical protein [Salegentibacter sp.]SFN79522.1 hypothetical protein SAMN05660413_02616 [Salegentibacter flavus]